MSLWFRPKDIERYEDKRFLDEHLEKMRRKHDNFHASNYKEGIKLMIFGIISATILSFFDYGLKYFDLSLSFKVIFKIGMILSTVSTLQFPLGLYKFIRWYGIKNDK